MDQQLVIKLSEETNTPIGVVESPPMLYTNLKRLFPNKTFSDKATPSEVEPHGYGVYEWAWAPTGLAYTRSYDEVGLSRNNDGVWRFTFVEREATEAERAERTELRSEIQRGVRNNLLTATDYTQLPDAKLSPEKIQEFVAYRQALRDIPEQQGFPWDIEFPTPPVIG
jgi:hypothetical protein